MTVDYVACGSLIIDDIVFADGTTYMNTIGGAGTHAVFGMRVWSDRVGYVSAVGDDFDPAHRATLEEAGIDLRGTMVRPDVPTPRAWQILEDHHRRIEIFRTAADDLDRIEATFDEIPDDYRLAQGMHLHRGSGTDMVAFTKALRDANPEIRLGWEPGIHHLSAPEDEIKAILPGVDFCSPCLEEGREMTGETAPEGTAERLLEWGAKIVALRMGAAGSLVVTADGERLRVPAVPTDVVDTTGAGNAYCGGFIVGLSRTGDVAEAAAYATVSASFAIEQVGIPRFDEGTVREAERRLAWTRERLAADRAPLPGS